MNAADREIPIPRKVPRGERRRAELVVMAEKMFLENGYTGTTMQMIASRAGGSKETLYRHFASKEAMFAEIMQRRVRAIFEPLDAEMQVAKVETVLLAVGTKLMQDLMTDEVAALLRLVVAESSRSPLLAEVFYTKGPGMMLTNLADYLRLAVSRGQLQCDDPVLAARMFLGAVTSHYHLHALIGQPKISLSQRGIQEHVRAATMMFLQAYADDRGHRSQAAR